MVFLNLKNTRYHLFYFVGSENSESVEIFKQCSILKRFFETVLLPLRKSFGNVRIVKDCVNRWLDLR